MADMLRAVARFARDRSLSFLALCDISEALVAQDYPIREWLGDSGADRDMKAFFRKISTKVALGSDVSDAVQERFYLSEFHIGTEEALGLGLAYLLNTAGVSLASDRRWRQAEILVRHVWLSDDASEQQRTVGVLNIWDTVSVGTVGQRQLATTQLALRDSPQTLADRKKECFPHLLFGRDLDTQIRRLSGVVLDRVVSRLISLDGLARDWRRNESDPLRSLLIRRESEATMNKYGGERVFKTADDANATFEPHASVGTSHRIHLRLNYANKTIEIGYIGKHLRTKKFPS